MKYIRKEEGFRNQELYVIPPHISSDESRPLLIRNLMVCDAGYFPAAAGHQKSREGIEEGVLLFCTAGEGFVRSGSEATVFLRAAQACYLPPRMGHIYGASDREPWSLYWMHIKGELLESYTAPLKGYEGIIPLCGRSSEQLSVLFSFLLDTMKDGYSDDSLLKSGQLAATIMTVLLHGNRAFHRDLSRSNLKRVDRVIAKMGASLEEGVPLGLQDMADYLGLSVPHFSDVFKRARGCSPVEYYSRLKIQKACRLLEMTELEIQDIARHSGYADRYYFSRVFKKIMGLSPSLYRERAGQASEGS